MCSSVRVFKGIDVITKSLFTFVRFTDRFSLFDCLVLREYSTYDVATFLLI